MPQNMNAELGKQAWAPWEAETCPGNPGGGSRGREAASQPCIRTKLCAGEDCCGKQFPHHHPEKAQAVSKQRGRAGQPCRPSARTKPTRLGSQCGSPPAA